MISQVGQPNVTNREDSNPRRGFEANDGLANSRFHTLLFGINRLRSDGMPYFGAKYPAWEHLRNYCATRAKNSHNATKKPSRTHSGYLTRTFWTYRKYLNEKLG